MPLTPEDVSNKRFTPVRLREGYDMGEVDQFLDEVEAELARLTRENDDLRSKLSAAQQGGGVRPGARARPGEGPRAGQGPRADARRPHRPRRAAPTETIKVTTVAEASSAAARLLEIATRNADELVGEAKDEADKIVGEARTKAERLEAESKAKADRLESDARTRSQMLDSETAERRQQLFGDLEKEKDKLNGEVENLRSFEREYRSRLKSYFQQQLAALDGSGEGGDPRRRRPRAQAAARPCSATRATPARLTEHRRDRRTTHEAGAPPGAPASCVRPAPGQTRVDGERQPEVVVAAATRPPSSPATSRLGASSVASTSLGDQVARARASASAGLAVGLPAQRDPVADVEAAGLAGLLHQPDHLAGQAGAHAAPGSARGRARRSRPAR